MNTKQLETSSSSSPVFATLKSEWLKLRTTRAIINSALIASFVTLALTALHCHTAAGLHSQVDGTGASLFGISVAQFVAVVCGSLAVTSDYASGTIAYSIIACPQRIRLAAAKLAVLLLATLTFGILLALASYGLGHLFLGSADVGPATTWSILRRLLGAAAVLSGMSFLGAACGFIARSTAPALLLVAAIIVLPKLAAQALPANDAVHIGRYTPLSVADSLISVSSSSTLSPGVGLIVFVLQLAAVSAVAISLFSARDA